MHCYRTFVLFEVLRVLLRTCISSRCDTEVESMPKYEVYTVYSSQYSYRLTDPNNAVGNNRRELKGQFRAGRF